MSRVSVESAVHDDLPAIRDLLEELLEAVEDDEYFESDRALENCSVLMDDATSRILVAKEGGTVVGFINLTVRRTILHSEPSSLIDELVVAKSHRGKGIGRILVDAAVSASRELGCSEIEVSTEKANSAARRFYRKCGFDEASVLLELHF
jgi:ribosomal protein S18 acetylase RimI-like enzyme